ncbi:hypothetical protein Trydic_g4061 [Trypoxylus dichotomus]
MWAIMKNKLGNGGGLLYYLTFIAIKVKVIFVIGTIIAIALFAGKAFAIFKYASLFNNNYRQTDDVFVSNPPSSYSGDHHEIILDHPPPGYGDHHDHIEYRKSSKAYPANSYYPSYGGQKYSYSSYARSIGNALGENVNIVKDVIKRMDLTEYAFNSMEIKSESCKKLFVCEADFRAKSSGLLALGLYIFGDVGFTKYRSKPSANSMLDCRKMYPDCEKSFR